MRLDKFLSHGTDLSRKQCRRLIKTGRVTVNGEPVNRSDRPVDTGTRVCIDDDPITLPGQEYWLMYKPSGYVCTAGDGEHPSVLDLLPPAMAQLSVAGRLDLDTTGLVLLSNDGQWIHRVTSPRHGCQKVYEVTLDAPLDPDTIQQFAHGLLLRGETKPTRPATLTALDGNRAEVTIGEGRYHQVKRMFAACGHRVLALHRRQIGPITLDPSLQPGDYRPLDDTEITRITAHA